MQKCKIKSLEEANYVAMRDKTLKEIKRDFKIQTILMIILVILSLYVCFRSMKLAVDYEALEKEKQALEDTVEMQSSMINDLEENCKDLYIEIERLRYE